MNQILKTMKVRYYIEKHELLTTEISFEAEWNHPFFPRVGERINASLLIDWIAPDVMYDALVEEEKEIWDDSLAEDVKNGISEEESINDNLYTCLSLVSGFVSEIVWTKDEVLITLREKEYKR